MPKFMRALLTTIVFGTASGGASTPAEKEFRSVDGLVRITAAPAPAILRFDAAGNPIEVSASLLDTLSDLSSLSTTQLPDDALLGVYFLDNASGEELRFPARISHIQDFLRAHEGEITGGSPEARSVSMIRALSKGMRVHMVRPGTGDSK